ncbi:hypothetical protein LVJ94_21380 [Pendulispora rubella]|uniref:Cytochrome c domain-containing protein n=1 Tax=Pendulispora rubella TaxID=2741070 RepID=A0ABZ2LFU2_9BACT
MRTSMERWGSVALALACLTACSERVGGDDGARQRLQAESDAGDGGVEPDEDDAGLAPLRTVPIPQPSHGDIVDHAAAVQLGKAFFWDTQAGSDGQTACASCHFAAGADNRVVNTMNPGPNNRFESNGVTGPGQTALISNIGKDDRLGSQGVRSATFVSIASDPSSAADVCVENPKAPFGGERQVTGRNTPSVVGAVFFRQLFWDGRGHDVFNGLDPFGTTGNAEGTLTQIDHAGLASQATGPTTNDVEMSCTGRPFNGPGSVGAKLLARRPLQFQEVAPTDGVLGALSASPERGLQGSYHDLIDKAFRPDVAVNAEAQFSRIWGQAIQAYESTLIPDQTPLDRYLEGQASALTAKQVAGLNLFAGKAECYHCHPGPELSDATYTFAAQHGLVNEDGGDQGFHHIGVRPVAFRNPEDLGRAANGPKGIPFSVSRANVDRGAFKTPQLRNIKLTAPYFHNGGKATLTDVVNFYAQGGDFSNPSSRLRAINFLPGEAAALVDFLTNGLTDCRTENERAPFDHPSLTVPNGPSLPAVGADGHGACP